MKKAIILAAAALLGAAPATAAVQIIDNGILTGAGGVIVDGTSYNVEFLDGACSALFSGCDQASDFAFTTFGSATLAANALLEQVLIGAYDTNPALTRGCSGTSSCTTIIPYDSTNGIGFGRRALNSNQVVADVVLAGGSFGIDYDTTPVLTFNYARFTLSSATGAVPEPSTWAMMLMGFGAMGVSLRRRRKLTNVAQFA